jgi:hypothetical protein
MSNWTTDRLPTAGDADKFGDVWVTLENGFVCEWNWRSVKPQMPWQTTNKPAPYVKPKRWTVEWNNVVALWSLRLNGEHYGYLPYAGLSKETAQRICDIYNEVLP